MLRPLIRLLALCAAASAAVPVAASAQPLKGTPGSDRLTGTPAADTLRGGRGADALDGRDGPDRLYGGRGADLIVADGLDRVYAGGGDDRVTVRADHVRLRVACGPGRDRLTVRVSSTQSRRAIARRARRCESLVVKRVAAPPEPPHQPLPPVHVAPIAPPPSTGGTAPATSPTPEPNPKPQPEPRPGVEGIPTLGAWSWCHLDVPGECEAEADWLQETGVEKWVVMGAGNVDDPTLDDRKVLAQIAFDHGLRIHWNLDPWTYTDEEAAEIVDAVKDLPGTGGYVIANEPEFSGDDSSPDREEYDDRLHDVLRFRDLARAHDPNPTHILQGVSSAISRYNGNLDVANVSAHGMPYISMNAADDWGIDAFPIGWGNPLYDHAAEVSYPLGKWLAEETVKRGMRAHFVIQAFDLHRLPTVQELREQRDCAVLGMTDGGQPLERQELWLFFGDPMDRSDVTEAMKQPYAGCREPPPPPPPPVKPPLPEPLPPAHVDDGEPADLFVAPSGSDVDNDTCAADRPCRTLSHAYVSAQAGAVVEVAGGTYGDDHIGESGDEKLPEGTKPVTFRNAAGVRPALALLDVRAADVTVRGLEVEKLNLIGPRQTYEDVDANARYEQHPALEHFTGADDVIFRDGRVGAVINDKGALLGENRMTFDNVLFHNAIYNSPTCAWAAGAEGLTIRNSTFRGCAGSDIFFTTYAGGPPHGNITLENNVFEHATQDELDSWHQFSVLVDPSVNDLTNWNVRNNTFETRFYTDLETGSGVWANNIGEWVCFAGMTFRNNVGMKCDESDKEVTPAASSATVTAPFGWTDPATHDFHLEAGSPAIDWADPAYAPATDRDGNPRGTAPDAGAYERP
jgi:cell division septation protein DedD